MDFLASMTSYSAIPAGRFADVAFLHANPIPIPCCFEPEIRSGCICRACQFKLEVRRLGDATPFSCSTASTTLHPEVLEDRSAVQSQILEPETLKALHPINPQSLSKTFSYRRTDPGWNLVGSKLLHSRPSSSETASWGIEGNL